MKVELLRKLIREEVRAAVKEELQEVMTEAVRIASTPATEKSSVVATPKKVNAVPTQVRKGQDSITAMLEQTKANMTNEEYKNVLNMNSSMVSQPAMAQTMMTQMNRAAGNQVGIDISQLDFVGKAKQVLDAANQKDLQRRV